MSTKDDNELVFEVINGDIACFEILVIRYQKRIFNLVNHMVGNRETAKDLTQDIFVKVFEKMGGFNFKYRFFSWIYRIAINETINRKKSNHRAIELQPAHYLIVDDNSFSHREERKSKILTEGLQELSPEYRMLIVLKYFSGLSYDEIAQANDLPLKKVRSRLFIAREKLQNILVQKGFLEDE